MATMTTKLAPRLIHTQPRKHMCAKAYDVWRFYRDEVGVYAEAAVDETRMTPEERAEYDAYVEKFDHLPDWMKEQDEEQALAGRVRFPTIILARRYAALEDEERTIAEDMDAMKAPSECYELAYSSLRSRREALMGWSLC